MAEEQQLELRFAGATVQQREKCLVSSLPLFLVHEHPQDNEEAVFYKGLFPGLMIRKRKNKKTK